ncbi:GNAT family N-acetyltransferase [Desulfonatronum sp. SC1]|uniref:GNAT family N-acetyltransferase n=1 Tax=Desulfonatronum sp. SC1 TaxID=2109626 RepID=UPI001304B96F|nr:GNAT family N-acetyltransferase [Desulfonatronum sp. SC1]
MKYRIVPVDHSNISKARALVDTVFPHQSPAERISLRLYTLKSGWTYRFLSWVFGADLLAFWIAVDESGEALGISGLYRLRKDGHEAVWLGWYAVHPSARGKGVGGALLRHAIQAARYTGGKYLRLYTSDSELIEGSGDAQGVYEKYGLKVKSVKAVYGGLLINRDGVKVLKANKIIREMPLR